MKRLDRDNFESFILDNSILFHYFARKYISNQHVIEDILQDCYVKLWDIIDHAEHIGNAKLYMFGMIKNACLNSNKKGVRVLLVDSYDEDTSSDGSIIQEIFDSEASTMIARAINSLPKKYARIMVLSLKGYKNAQIATILNLSEDSVKSQKKRAMKKLSTLMDASLG